MGYRTGARRCLSLIHICPILAAAFGQTLTADAEARHEGSELIELNK